ncbi:MAG: hypothetical protein LC708_01210, partial [Actinobacteria bacterium]|nr:hypothetical protein [Actinomycetota bacterium]
AEAVVVTAQSSANLTTNASGSVPVGGTIRDTATLSGGLTPTGTITFDLYGPDDATCAGPAVFTSTVPVNGNGSYDSAAFTPTLPGTYRWRAIYSGDANNTPVGPTACADPAEAVVVTRASPSLVTNASAAVSVGGTVRDTATLSGGFAPTGTITFTLFGPDDATCTGSAAFTSTVPVNGNGNYDSGDFTATLAGTYRWVASYSGDVSNNAAGPTACTDPAETVVVGDAPQANPTLATNASGSVPVGGTIRDTATLANGTNPTGTITFNLYGHDDATCSGPVVFTSTVPVNGNGSYDSASFTPTQPGTYRWRASYSGDAANAAAGPTACTDPAEAVVVTAVVASITVTKTADPLTRPEPGGTFTFGVVVTNTGPTPVTLTALTDDVYGNLAGRGSCAVGAVLDPNGGTHVCSFPGDFTGASGSS